MATTWLRPATSAPDAIAHPLDELVSFNAPGSLEADQYRALRHVVERLSHDTALKVIAITSPGPGDGKTVTTLNLAGSLAQGSSARVLVIDADLHRPGVAANLGIASDDGQGLEDALNGDDTGRATRASRRIDALNLSVLLPGNSDAPPYQVLGSPHVGSLLAQARAQYDYVLIDTPPLVPLADVRLLAPWVDGILVVVSAHRTPRRQLLDAMAAVDREKVVGIVFNGDDQPIRHRYYGYYSRRRVATAPKTITTSAGPRPVDR
jgi:capsular exopolysaccharide synthesis family protein